VGASGGVGVGACVVVVGAGVVVVVGASVVVVVGASVVVVVAGANVDVVRTVFFTRDVEAGTLTSSEPPPHDAATRTPITSRPAAVFMPRILS